MAVNPAVRRGVLTMVDDGGRMQRLQVEVRKGQLIHGAEHWLPYGFSCGPLPTAECVVLAAGGSDEHAIVLVTDRRYRLKPMARGEMAIHDDQGQVVHLTRDGILIRTAKRVVVESTGPLHLDAGGGVGVTYQTGRVDDYTQGCVKVTHPPTPWAAR